MYQCHRYQWIASELTFIYSTGLWSSGFTWPYHWEKPDLGIYQWKCPPHCCTWTTWSRPMKFHFFKNSPNEFERPAAGCAQLRTGAKFEFLEQMSKAHVRTSVGVRERPPWRKREREREKKKPARPDRSVSVGQISRRGDWFHFLFSKAETRTRDFSSPVCRFTRVTMTINFVAWPIAT